MLAPAGVCPERLHCSSRSGHENDPDSLHSAGPGVPENGSVDLLICLPSLSLFHIFTPELNCQC